MERGHAMLFADDASMPGFRAQDWPWWAIAVYLIIDKLYPWMKQWWAESRESAKAAVEVDKDRAEIDDTKAVKEISRLEGVIKQWKRLVDDLTGRLGKLEERYERRVSELEKESRDCQMKGAAQEVQIAHLTEQHTNMKDREREREEEIKRLRSAIWRMREEGADADSDLFDTPQPDGRP